MKKFLCAVCATFSAAAYLATFTACDFGGSDGGNGIDANTDIKAFASERVTEEEWNTAFRTESFTNAEFRYRIYQKGGYIDDMQVVYGGDKRKFTQTVEVDTSITVINYVSKENGRYYNYSERKRYDGGDGYIKEEVARDEWDDLSISAEENILVTPIWQAADYSKANWNSNEKGYVFYADIDDERPAFVFKFKDKKIAGFYTLNEMEGGIVYTGLFYNYGTATVTLPPAEFIDDKKDDEILIDENTDPTTIVSEQLTEEEWAAAFAEDNFANATMFMSNGSRYIKVVSENGKTVWDQDDYGTKYVIYCEKIDDKFYEYEFLDGKWERKEVDESYEQYSVYGAVMSLTSVIVSYEWNGKDGYTCYVQDDDDHEVALTLKFVNKKLALYSTSYPEPEVENGITTENWLFYNYGKSKASLPE